jgi:hypothetical protein
VHVLGYMNNPLYFILSFLFVSLLGICSTPSTTAQFLSSIVNHNQIQFPHMNSPRIECNEGRAFLLGYLLYVTMSLVCSPGLIIPARSPVLSFQECNALPIRYTNTSSEIIDSSIH